MKRIGMLAAVMAIGAFGCASNQNKEDTDPDKKELIQNDKDVEDADVTPKDGDDPDLAKDSKETDDDEEPSDDPSPEANTGE